MERKKPWVFAATCVWGSYFMSVRHGRVEKAQKNPCATLAAGFPGMINLSHPPDFALRGLVVAAINIALSWPLIPTSRCMDRPLLRYSPRCRR